MKVTFNMLIACMAPLFYFACAANAFVAPSIGKPGAARTMTTTTTTSLKGVNLFPEQTAKAQPMHIGWAWWLPTKLIIRESNIFSAEEMAAIDSLDGKGNKRFTVSQDKALLIAQAILQYQGYPVLTRSTPLPAPWVLEWMKDFAIFCTESQGFSISEKGGCTPWKPSEFGQW
jgi:hypothetical protein